MVGFFTHPTFTDVCFYAHKSFYVKEKDIYKIKITWYSKKKRWMLGYDKLVVTPQKMKEFKRLNNFYPVN